MADSSPPSPCPSQVTLSIFHSHGEGIQQVWGALYDSPKLFIMLHSFLIIPCLFFCSWTNEFYAVDILCAHYCALTVSQFLDEHDQCSVWSYCEAGSTTLASFLAEHWGTYNLLLRICISHTRHQGQLPFGWAGLIRVDNSTTYKWLGDVLGPPFGVAGLNNTVMNNIEITATRTIMSITAGPVDLNVTYFSPIEVSHNCI